MFWSLGLVVHASSSKHPDQRHSDTLKLTALEKLHESSPRIVGAFVGVFCVTTRGLDCSFPLSSLLKPRTLPMIPGGFGTGHSCAFFLIMAFSSSEMCRGICFSRPTSELSSIGPSVVRRRRFRLPSSITSKSESANLTRGAGHGTMCGIPTTRKETRRVVPKREVVRRDRGWRWGVMASKRREWKRFSRRRLKGHAVAIAMSWLLDVSKAVRHFHTAFFVLQLLQGWVIVCCSWDENVRLLIALEPRPTGDRDVAISNLIRASEALLYSSKAVRILQQNLQMVFWTGQIH